MRLDGAVALIRLPAADGWMLSYGRFRTLLPSALEPAAQAELLAAGVDLRSTVFKAPGPDTGAWPTTAFLVASAPQRILWPEGTTYPPDRQGSQREGERAWSVRDQRTRGVRTPP